MSAEKRSPEVNWSGVWETIVSWSFARDLARTMDREILCLRTFRRGALGNAVRVVTKQLCLSEAVTYRAETVTANETTCAYCDRAVYMVVSGEARCSWHVTGRLGGDGLRIAQAARRARQAKT